jgi:hypothetical protein
MERNRCRDLGAKRLPKHSGAERFMMVVGHGPLSFGKHEQMADVMEEGGGDELVGCTISEGEVGALQGVGALAHGLVVPRRPEGSVEHVEQPLEGLGKRRHRGCSAGRPRKSSVMDSRTLSPSKVPSVASNSAFLSV